MKRFDALVVLIRAVGVYCAVHGLATLGQAVAVTCELPAAGSMPTYFFVPAVIFLLAAPLLIWGAKFCARLCGESDDTDDEEDSSI
jgi:hypothetical protein